MPVFIALCLTLSYLVETESSVQALLVSPVVIYIGLFFAVISIACIFFKKANERLCYDVFASGTLLIWFSSWKPNFSDQAPMFFFFPIYFALASAFVTFIVLTQKQNIDKQTLAYMKKFLESSGMEPWIVMILILCSLGLQQHFMLFPAFFTLLLFRFTISGCLEKN